MLLGKIIVVAALISVCLGASLTPCPQSCTCEGMTSDKIGLECTSLEFLNRLLPKQVSGTVKLNASGLSLETFDPKLKSLKNLEILDISNNKLTSTAHFPHLPKLKQLSLKGNKIKNVNDLPTSIESLDISSNSIYEITTEWTLLTNLKHLNLNKNPIDCTCETLLYHDKLAEMGVIFRDPVRCSSPKTFKGKRLESLNCSVIADNLLNTMMGDQLPEEDYVIDSGDDSDYEDHDYITDYRSDKDTDKQSEEFEGSGDEGSGYSPIENEKEEALIACHENCSTIAPVGLHDEDNASPPPSIPESAKILLEDIIGKSEEPELKSETEQTVASVEETITKQEVPKIEQEVPIKEEEEYPGSDKDTENVDTNNVVPGEMERAMAGASTVKDSNATYYVLGGILVVFIVLIVAVVLRKRSMKKKNRRHKAPLKENGQYEEMKPLKSNGTSADKEQVIPEIKENAPLIGEGNGKIGEIDPEKGRTTTNGTPKSEIMDSTNTADDLKPEADQSPKSDTLKVTIKASEIPDSIPKTPILVHRQLNNDGNYTTTFQESP